MSTTTRFVVRSKSQTAAFNEAARMVEPSEIGSRWAEFDHAALAAVGVTIVPDTIEALAASLRQACYRLDPEPTPEPAGEPVALSDPVERLAAAKAEYAGLKAWKAAGEPEPRPATPNLDAVNAEHAAGGRKARKARKAEPVPAPVPAAGEAVLDLHTARRASIAADLAAGSMAAVGNWVVYRPADADQTVARIVERTADRGQYEGRVAAYLVARLVLDTGATDPRSGTAAKMLRLAIAGLDAGKIDRFDVVARPDGTLGAEATIGATDHTFVNQRAAVHYLSAIVADPAEATTEAAA